MIDFLRSTIVAFSDTLTVNVMLCIMLVLSLGLAWQARQKKYNPVIWYGIGAGAYILAYGLMTWFLPTTEPTAPFSKWETLWQSSKLRADMLLFFVAIAGGYLLIQIFSRLRQQTLLSDQVNRRVATSFLGIPLLIWIIKAAELINDKPERIAAVLGFVAAAGITASIVYFLDDMPRRYALLSFAIILLALQVYHNSTIEKPDSILAPTINIPVYMPLIPFALGWMIANTLNKYLPVRRIIPLFWDFVLLAWGFSVFSFLTSFFGEYEFGGSFVSDLADTLKAPFQVSARFLGDVFYQVIPREIATEDNLQAAQDVNFILATLVGMVTWGMVWYWLRWSSPIAARSGTFNPIRFWQNMSLKQQRYFAAFVLITPAILLRAFTTLYPFAETLALSVQKHNPAFPPRSYAGLNNFERLANDLVVRESLQFTLLFVFGSTFFQVTLGLAIAHLLNANFSLRGLARMISLIPWAIPMVVVGIASRWLFDDEFGMIPDLAGRVFGVETNWLIDPKVAKYAVITMSVWKSTPFVALVLLAGLQGIPQDLYEAARVDGASRYQQLRFVTVPMLLPIIVTTSMFMLVWQLAAFDLPFTMTGGGPGFSTTVLAQKIYLEINSLNYSFAASLGIMLVGLVMVIGGVGMYLFRRVEVTQ